MPWCENCYITKVKNTDPQNQLYPSLLQFLLSTVGLEPLLMVLTALILITKSDFAANRGEMKK